MRVTEVLHRDHETVEQLFAQLEKTPRTDAEGRQALLDRIAEELEVHAKAEEEIFYRALRAVSTRVDEAEEEHREIESLSGDAEGRDPSSDDFASKVAELKRKVQHHVSEEESELFTDAERLGTSELERLGKQFAQRKETLKTSIVQRGLRAVKQAARKVS